MTKQQSQQPETSSYMEEDFRDIILRHYKKQEEFVEKVRKINRDNGVSNALNDMFAVYKKPLQQGRYETFLEKITNKKSGRFYSIDSLVSAGEISPQEAEFYEKSEPYRQIFALQRIQTPDKREFLVRREVFYGISRSGNVEHITVADHDYYTKPTIDHEFMSASGDPNDKESNQVRVSKVPYNLDNMGDQTGTREYFEEFTVDKVKKAMQHARGLVEDKANGVSLTLIKVGQPNPIAVRSVEQFCQPFDEIYNEITKPAPVINVNGKEILKDIARGQAQQQYG